MQTTIKKIGFDKVEIDNSTIGKVNGKLEVKIDPSGSNILYSSVANDR